MRWGFVKPSGSPPPGLIEVRDFRKHLDFVYEILDDSGNIALIRMDITNEFQSKDQIIRMCEKFIKNMRSNGVNARNFRIEKTLDYFYFEQPGDGKVQCSCGKCFDQ